MLINIWNLILSLFSPRSSKKLCDLKKVHLVDFGKLRYLKRTKDSGRFAFVTICDGFSQIWPQVDWTIGLEK